MEKIDTQKIFKIYDNWPKIAEKSFNLDIIEDAAHAVGTTWKNFEKIGTQPPFKLKSED